jgi:hypothetical protein
MVDENSAAGKAGVNAKRFLTRVTAPDISTKNLLMSMVLTDLAGKSKEDYWKTLVQNSFQIVTVLKLGCADQAYDNSKKSLPTFS